MHSCLESAPTLDRSQFKDVYIPKRDRELLGIEGSQVRCHWRGTPEPSANSSADPTLLRLYILMSYDIVKTRSDPLPFSVPATFILHKNPVEAVQTRGPSPIWTQRTFFRARTVQHSEPEAKKRRKLVQSPPYVNSFYVGVV